MQAHTMQRPKIEFANTLRGVAAMLVLVSHYLGVFWTNRDDAARYTLLPHLPERFATPLPVEWLHFHPWINWGALGVGLFFLISGFVIPFSLVNRSRFSFVVARACRLVPTYSAGFTITLISIYYGTKAAGIQWPFSVYDIVIHYVPGIRDHVRTPNIDGIIWTLEVEVKFYIIVMILAPWLTRRPIAILLVPLAIAVLHKAYFETASLLNVWMPMVDWVLRPFALAARFLVLMFMGVTLHLRYSEKVSYPNAAAALAVQYALFVYLWPNFSNDASVGAFLSYSAAIPIFMISMKARRYFRAHPITSFFADISYPLYVIHAVMGYILMKALLLSGWSTAFVIVVATLTSVSIATALHYAVERPTQNVGRMLGQRLRHIGNPKADDPQTLTR